MATLRIINTYHKIAAYSFGIFVLQSCYHVHQNEFGPEYNEVRVKLKLPVIEDTWTRKDEWASKAPQHYTTWYTNLKPTDETLPYHAYKTIYFSKDILVAEADTYLNMHLKWFDHGAQLENQPHTLKNLYANYHCLRVVYVYEQMKLNDKDFTSYKKGFNYEIQGEKNGYSDIQILDSLQTEVILSGWNLKRLNY